MILIEDGVGSGQGVLEDPGDRDLFQMVLAENGTATIHVTSTDGRLDTYLRVYDEAGNTIAENDDFGGTFNSQLTLDLAAGQYYVDIGAYADWGIGEYQVAVQVVEVGLDPVQETELITLNEAGGTRLWDEIVSVGEESSYSFVATRTGRMTVRTNRLSYGMDTMLTAYDSQGEELAFNDDWRGLKSRVRFAVQEGETYRVDVSGYRDSVGSYRLALRTREVSDPFYVPPSDIFYVDLPVQEVETTVIDAVDSAAETVNSTIDQFEEQLDSTSVDAVWTETEQLINETGEEISESSSEVEDWLVSFLDLEVGWVNLFGNSWF